MDDPDTSPSRAGAGPELAAWLPMPPAKVKRKSASEHALLVWMAFALAAVVGIAYFDAVRESDGAFAAFAEEQASLASAIDTRDAARLDQDGERLVFTAAAGADDLVRPDGRTVRSPIVMAGLRAGTPWVRLSRSDAAALGLPPRSAVAAYGKAVDGHTRVVVTSAARERDREARVQSRLVVSILLGGVLVVSFGAAAMRRQRRELELARELALAQASRFAALGAFGTGVAHEISSPLAVIVGRAEQLMSKGEGDPRSARAVSAILENANRIGNTIRDFSDFARGERPSLTHVRVDELVERARQLVAHRFAEAGVTLRILVDEPVPIVACDMRLFVHAVVNLLLNACDASTRDHVVGLHIHGEPDIVTIEILDQGRGIRREDSARILEPFFTTKPPGAGSGLGLAITNEIVKHHQGRLVVEPRMSQPGTIAKIELPSIGGRT